MHPPAHSGVQVVSTLVSHLALLGAGGEGRRAHSNQATPETLSLTPQWARPGADSQVEEAADSEVLEFECWKDVGVRALGKARSSEHRQWNLKHGCC